MFEFVFEAGTFTMTRIGKRFEAMKMLPESKRKDLRREQAVPIVNIDFRFSEVKLD